MSLLRFVVPALAFARIAVGKFCLPSRLPRPSEIRASISWERTIATSWVLSENKRANIFDQVKVVMAAVLQPQQFRMVVMPQAWPNVKPLLVPLLLLLALLEISRSIPFSKSLATLEVPTLVE